MAQEKEVEIRYSIEVPKSVDDSIIKYIPWGIKSRLVLNIIKALAEQLEKDGAGIVGPLLNGKITILAVEETKETP